MTCLCLSGLKLSHLAGPESVTRVGRRKGLRSQEKKILNLYPFFFHFANETYQPLGVSFFCALVKHVLLRDATAITFYIDCYWYNKSWGSGVHDTPGVLLSK